MGVTPPLSPPPAPTRLPQVLYADIIRYSNAPAGMPPQEVVSLLNDVHNMYDSLLDKHGLIKIRRSGEQALKAGRAGRRARGWACRKPAGEVRDAEAGGCGTATVKENHRYLCRDVLGHA